MPRSKRLTAKQQAAAVEAILGSQSAGRITKYIKTEENWYPASPNKDVRVSLINLSDGRWRVCAWGDDDFGLERDFPADEQWEAWGLFISLTDYTSQHTMKNMGMQPA